MIFLPHGGMKAWMDRGTRLQRWQIAGANQVLKDKVLNTKKAQEQIAVCNASGMSPYLHPYSWKTVWRVLIIGIHVYSIPQYIVSQVINRMFPILILEVLTGSLHVSPNSIWYLTSMTISPSSPICNPLQWARMMMLMFSLQPNGPPEKICTTRSILTGNQVGHWVRNRYTARPQDSSWVLTLRFIAASTQWWSEEG